MEPDASVRNRVQIAPLGFEYARLKEPILRWKADVVVAIEYNESKRQAPFLRELIEELEANERIELDRRECDLFELYDALRAISEAVTDYGTDDVYVNLSAGSKITAIAGMIACMASDASPIYARPDYGPDGGRIPAEPFHEEVESVFELPTYPIERPSNRHLAFMAFIEEHTQEGTQGRYTGVSKKDLIEFALDGEFPFIVQSDTTTDKGYYRLLDRHILDPLVGRGYVGIEKVGRQKFVTLSEEGENTLRAFRHFIDR